MKAKEWKDLFKDINDETEVIPYIYDYEYDDAEPHEIGIGKFVKLEQGYRNSMYINIGVNKY